MASHEFYIQRCIDLAGLGLGSVAPNPMVGCVIVHEDQIIAEGFHEIFGGPHAEVNTIHKVKDDLLKECTLYVSLEPCSHYGQTPPCTDLIIRKGIKKVVIGSLDSNPLVSGRGIQKLKEAGIEVIYNILQKECKQLNRRFFTYHEKKRPYIILKWAQTQDGFISQWPLPENKEDNWITSEDSKILVHQWRTEEQAILIGYNTLVADNPLLTARLSNGRNPIRFILSRGVEFENELNAFNGDAKTVVFNTVKNESVGNVEFVKINWYQKVREVSEYCYKHHIISLIVEGGTNTIYNFMNANCWDESRVFINPSKNFEHGIDAPEINLNDIPSISVGYDTLQIVYNT